MALPFPIKGSGNAVPAVALPAPGGTQRCLASVHNNSMVRAWLSHRHNLGMTIKLRHFMGNEATQGARSSLGVQRQQLGFQSLINTKDRKFHCLRLRRSFPSRLCGFPLAQHKVGEKTNTPKTTPGTVHPGRGAALPRVTTVPPAMAAPQPCPCSIHVPSFPAFWGSWEPQPCNQAPAELIWAQGRAGCAVRLQPGPRASCSSSPKP